MSRPDDPRDFHDAVHDDDRRDALALAALGEPLDPEFAVHERTCPVCRAELEGLVRTVDLARGGVAPAPTRDVRPPAAVWEAIAREVRTGAPAPSAPPVGPPAPPVTTLAAARRRRRRWSVLAVAAAVAVVGAGVGGYAVGRDDAATGSCPTASAQLAPATGTAAGAGGRAEVVCSADGPALRVTTDRLPLASGYYEVWMYQPASGVMVAVGALGPDGTGTFTLPGGMDVRDYPVVDVSAQQFDGDPTHDRSVLQGPLTS